MIIRKEEQKITVNEQMRGGEGSVQLRQLLAPEQFCGHGRLFSQLELAPSDLLRACGGRTKKPNTGI